MFRKPAFKTCSMILIAVLTIPIVVGLFQLFGIVFTTTGSVPIGFYRKALGAIHLGDYVAICLPNKIAHMGMVRGYIGKGRCSNHTGRLLKKVIAMPGDQVIAGSDWIRVIHQGKTWNYKAPTHLIDRKGLAVFRFIQNGRYLAKGYWVYGNGDVMDSWDSRYYGEIPEDSITEKLKAVLIV